MVTWQSSDSHYRRFAGTASVRWAERRRLAATRRQEKAARRDLEAQLAAYSSPRDLAELYAIAGRATGDDADQLLRAIDRVH